MDRLELMKLFTRIYETRSLSRAARDLATTQSTVSKLEDLKNQISGTSITTGACPEVKA